MYGGGAKRRSRRLRQEAAQRLGVWLRGVSTPESLKRALTGFVSLPLSVVFLRVCYHAIRSRLSRLASRVSRDLAANDLAANV